MHHLRPRCRTCGALTLSSLTRVWRGLPMRKWIKEKTLGAKKAPLLCELEGGPQWVPPDPDNEKSLTQTV